MTRLANWVAVIGLCALIAVTGLTIIEIVLRSGPVSNLRGAMPSLDEALRIAGADGLSDIYGPLAVIAVAACFPAMLANRGAITVRFVANAMPWRLREMLGFIGDAVLLAMFALMTFWVGRYTHDLWQTGETTWLLELPRWPAWTLATLCLGMGVIVQTGIVIQQIRAGHSPNGPAPIGDRGQ